MKPLLPTIITFVSLIAMGVVVFGCASGTQEPKTVVFTDEEIECLAAEKARAVLEASSCGENVSGPCSTDSIYERSIERRKRCVNVR